MASKDMFWKEPVGNLPLQTPVIADTETTIGNVIDSMQKHKTGCVLIKSKESGELAGIFTERDVMHQFVATKMSKDTKLKDIMTSKPETLSPTTTVAEAINYFGEKHFRHLPICDEEHNILGLLSVRVMVDFIAENLPGDVLNLPPVEGVVSKEIAGG